jgi:exodeoxyribonuclease VII large subunit
MVNAALDSALPSTVRVIGEISGFRERTHWYFDLKDTDAVVSCVVFASSWRRLGFVPEAGAQVIVSGRVEFHAKTGRLSLIGTSVQPVGAGALDLALRRLVEELRALGWLDQERKRSLPVFPGRVAVITSRSGAALQDVLDTFRRRCPGVGVLLADARVQGDGAAAEVAARLRQIGEEHRELGVEVILITRGGGSAEDLWAFNDRELARAIVESPIPVVAAIGHETDTTVAELVADLRAATPTQAAMLIAPDAKAIGEQLDSASGRLGLALRRAVSSRSAELTGSQGRLRGAIERIALAGAGSVFERQRGDLGRVMPSRLHGCSARLERAAARLGRQEPARVAARRQAQRAAALGAADLRLGSAIRARLAAAKAAAASGARQLDAVGPLAVLERGYSVTLDASGRVVRRVADASAGASIETRLVDGSIRSVVGGAPDRSRAPRAVRRVDPAQMILFPRSDQARPEPQG